MEELHIFAGITPREQKAMHACFRSREQVFDAEETITTYTQTAPKLGVLLDGHARLYYSDADGNQSVIEELFRNDVFGELFLMPVGTQHYYVRACTPCRVLFIDHEHLIKRCPNACAHHSRLIDNLFRLAAQKAQTQANRINILTQPSARQKLLTYFDILCRQNETRSCTVPMSYSALAEYLCLNRSAMMRELKKLADENILAKNGRHIRLYRA